MSQRAQTMPLPYPTDDRQGQEVRNRASYDRERQASDEERQPSRLQCPPEIFEVEPEGLERKQVLENGQGELRRRRSGHPRSDQGREGHDGDQGVRVVGERSRDHSQTVELQSKG